jgi:hypothetical protein
LLRRNFVEGRRNIITTFVRIAQSIFMALFCGLLYFQLSDDQQSIMDRRGALFFMVCNQLACCLICAVYPAGIVGIFVNHQRVSPRKAHLLS